MSAERRDWEDLPPDLLHLISQKLPDITDLWRFRTVCKSWRSAAPLSIPPRQLPWLLECNELWHHILLQDNILRFYSLSTAETGSIPIKQSKRSSIYHGPCNNLFCSSSSDIGPCLLWNPLTDAEISITLFPNLGYLWPVRCSDQVMNRNSMPGVFPCYSDGMFFIMNIYGDSEVFDGNSKEWLYRVPFPDHLDVCRVKLYHVDLSGEILWVRYCYGTGQNLQDYVFDFYKLNKKGRNGQPYWVKVSDIDNHILFLGFGNGFSMKAPIAGMKGNCTFFFDRYTGEPYKYDIASGTIERVPCPFKISTWFVPSLN